MAAVGTVPPHREHQPIGRVPPDRCSGRTGPSTPVEKARLRGEGGVRRPFSSSTSTGDIEQFTPPLKRMSGRVIEWKLYFVRIVTQSEDEKRKNCQHVEIVAKLHFLKRRNCHIVEIVAHFFAGALRARVEIIFRGNCMRTSITK